MDVEVEGAAQALVQVHEGGAKMGRSRPFMVLATWLVGLALVAVGYKVVPFYYYYYDLKAVCASVTRSAEVESDEEIRRNLRESVRRVGIEDGASEIGIQRVGDHIRVWVSYEEELEVSFGGRRYTLYRFRFTPSAERRYED